MRHTSFRRRSGLRITGDLSRGGASPYSVPMVELLDEGDPAAGQCQVEGCGVWVRVLTNGRLQAHAKGGQKTNVRQGLYKCEGSGVT